MKGIKLLTMTYLQATRLKSGIFSLLLCSSFLLSEAQSNLEANIIIQADQVEGQLSPMLYGQFIEFMYEGIKGGLHAEMVRNRSFEEVPNGIGLSRYWERYPDDRNDDYALSFHWDDSIAYPVKTAFFENPPVQHALKVRLGKGVVQRHGIYQARLPIQAGMAYQGYVWMKTTGYEGRVLVAVEQDRVGGEIYAEAEIDQVSGDWKQYTFVLTPQKTDLLAKLAILFEGVGEIWIDQVSLLPDEAVGAVRKDVFEAVKALQPAFIRWPGGNVAQDYHWQWGIGPRDQRPVWPNLSWKNEPEPSDFGTDEFIAFCRDVGAEPTITVNVEGLGATAEEAAAWVAYCNSPATSHYGAMRAAHGHPEPYAVKYWEIGNEIWGDWVRGHSDATTYAQNYNRYVAAMRAVDSTIQFIAVGDNNMEWNRTVLRLSGKNMDYLAIHHYYGEKQMNNDAGNLMARPLFYERFYQEVEQMIRKEVPNHTLQLAINEWGLDLPEARQYSMESALYGARLMHVFERRSPVVAMSAVSDLINGWPGGIIQASRHQVFFSPLYHLNRLYQEHRGKERLKTLVKSPSFDTSQEGKGIPSIDAVVSRSANGKQIYIKVINTSHEKAIEVSFDVKGTSLKTEATWDLLTADDLKTHNSFRTPEAIVPHRRKIQGGTHFKAMLPQHSVSVISLQVDPSEP